MSPFAHEVLLLNVTFDDYLHFIIESMALYVKMK